MYLICEIYILKGLDYSVENVWLLVVNILIKKKINSFLGFCLYWYSLFINCLI